MINITKKVTQIIAVDVYNNIYNFPFKYFNIMLVIKLRRKPTSRRKKTSISLYMDGKQFYQYSPMLSSSGVVSNKAMLISSRDSRNKLDLSCTWYIRNS